MLAVSASLSAELAGFVRLAGDLSAETGIFPGFFAAGRPLTIARAPGRLDVMGGIADYSGSLVLELPIREGVFAAAQRSEDEFVRVASLAPDGSGLQRSLSIPTSELSRGYDTARSFFARSADDAWAAYVAGVLVALHFERPHVVRGGTRLLVSSAVPEGKGVASSAALTVASLLAVSVEHRAPLGPTRLAALCQTVENRVVGAPCGSMDPMSSACGEEGKLLELLCQPAEILGQLPVPAGVSFFGIDSGLRHAVSGSDYGEVRAAAFMGYRIIAEREGLRPVRRGEHFEIDDPKYSGYLANVGVETFGAKHREALPEQLLGAEFLARYGGTTDTVTQVDPTRTYPVRAATAHPIFEHARVKQFVRLLRGEPTDEVLIELGALMSDSHASYSACGLGSDGTDRLVELVREAGPSAGLFGAKITGGGSGGTVAVLARAGAGAEAAVERVRERYVAETGRSGYVFRGSSPGAVAFGVSAHALRR